MERKFFYSRLALERLFSQFLPNQTDKQTIREENEKFVQFENCPETNNHKNIKKKNDKTNKSSKPKNSNGVYLVDENQLTKTKTKKKKIENVVSCCQRFGFQVEFLSDQTENKERKREIDYNSKFPDTQIHPDLKTQKA